jgi:eukaryotic-like serine/threonine-protein kinase
VQQAAVDPLIGRLLEGRYRILDRIARGGMSTVYAAVDERLDRRVAVKVMAPALSSDDNFTDRFAREARAAARLNHVNAVAVFDQGVDASGGGRNVFLVMELVQGRTLRDLIRERQGRFSVAEAVSIMEPVLSALSAAHRAGLVHRDIKPENILLSDDGLVKVADFGLARATDADAASTRTGLMMGTVAYCAPEQIVHGQAEPRTDVYSAGIVFFELLTGRTPYHGDSAMNVAYQHVHSRVPAPSSKIGGVPIEIDEILVAATDSDPTGRPQDASAFLAELADARAQLALPVLPVPIPRRRARSGPPHAVSAMGSAGHRGSPGGPPQATASTRPVHGSPPDSTRELQRPAPRPQYAPANLPPPVVIPPRRGGRPALTPRQRRRRRRIIMLILVILLGAASVAGGIIGVKYFRDWSAARNLHVPKVSGYTVPKATNALVSMGYTVNHSRTNQFSETVPADLVIGTDPGGGQKLAKGGTVRLIVSLGKHRIPVPSVRNDSLADAETALQALTIKRFATRPSIRIKQGDVITTRPGPGTKLKPGAPIVIVQSSGLPSFTVPTIPDGTSYEDAAAAIHGVAHAHFSVDRRNEYNDRVPADVVVRVDGAGQRAEYGSTIPVVVSKGPQLVSVPDVTEFEPYDDVASALQQVGLVPDVRKIAGGHYSRVYRIDPPSGTQVPVGSTVTVWIV